MNQSGGILLLDETQAGRLQLQKEVTHAGLPVAGEAGTAREAITAARELQPDIVLVALEEPLARALRSVETVAASLPDVPVVAVAPGAGRELFRKAILAGAHDLLERPLKPKELAETMELAARMAEKRRLRGSDPSRLLQGTVISIFGPKGGVGKTTLATNLGVCIASTGQDRAIVVDLDTQVGATAINLDIIPHKGVLDVVENFQHVDRDMLKSFVSTHPSGLDVLPAPLWGQEEQDELTPDDVEQLLGLVATHYDYVIVDTPGHLDALVLRALQVSTYMLCVTSLEISSIQACKRVLDRVSGWEFARDKIKIVTNVPNSANSIGKSDVEAALGHPVFWGIPFDMQVGAASQQGQAVVQAHPGAKAAQAISQLHYALVGSQAPKAGGLGGLLKGWKR